jgi:hypothetical protein
LGCGAWFGSGLCGESLKESFRVGFTELTEDVVRGVVDPSGGTLAQQEHAVAFQQQQGDAFFAEVPVADICISYHSDGHGFVFLS